MRAAASAAVAGAGYAPATETERLVFEAEHYLNSRGFKARFPETGEDVKVMGVREKRELHLTIAMPLLDRALASEDEYFSRIEDIREAVLAHLRSRLEQLDELTVGLNVLDRRGEGLSGIYASVLLVHLAPGAVLADVAAVAEAMIASELAQLPAFCRDIAADVYTVV